MGSVKDTKALTSAASSEAEIESPPTAGIFGMFTAGSDPRGPDPSVGMVKGVKADRWVGFQVGDRAPASGTSTSDGVEPGMSTSIAGYDPLGRSVRHGGQNLDLQSGSEEAMGIEITFHWFLFPFQENMFALVGVTYWIFNCFAGGVGNCYWFG